MSERFKPVLTKQDFVKRYAKGEFGNKSPTWLSYKDWMGDNEVTEYSRTDDYRLYHIRNRVAGGPTYYNLGYYEVGPRWFDLIRKGVPAHQLYISEMAPTDKTLIQGEVIDRPGGVEIFYSTDRLTMRSALEKSGKRVNGVVARLLLSYYLCPSSLDWLEVLLDRYPNHVIEFSTYDTRWGDIPGFNTVFWEVRNY